MSTPNSEQPADGTQNIDQNAAANTTATSQNTSAPPFVNAPPGFPNIPPRVGSPGPPPERSPLKQDYNPEDTRSYFDPPLFPSQVGLREILQTSAPVKPARDAGSPRPPRRHSAPGGRQPKMAWVESKPALPHVPAEPGQFNPYRYVFKVEHHYIHNSIENAEVRCPPFHILIDHTIGVLWCIHNSDELPHSWTIGLTQLYWALRFLELLENEDESYPRDIAAAIKQIHIEILDLLDLAYTNWAEIAEHYPPDQERVRPVKYDSFDISGQPIAASSRNPIIVEPKGPIAASTPVRSSAEREGFRGPPEGSPMHLSHISHDLPMLQEEFTPPLPAINDQTEVRPTDKADPRLPVINQTEVRPTDVGPAINDQTGVRQPISNQTEIIDRSEVKNQTYEKSPAKNQTYEKSPEKNQTYEKSAVLDKTRLKSPKKPPSPGAGGAAAAPVELPFSVNYLDMLARVPEDYEKSTPTCGEAGAEADIYAELDRQLADMLNADMAPFLYNARKVQMQNVMVELDRLKTIEDSMALLGAEIEGYKHYYDEKDREISVMFREKIDIYQKLYK